MAETMRALEVLARGMRLEEDGRRFYLKAAEEATDPKGKEMFLSLADDERLHYDFIKRQHDSLKREGGWVIVPEAHNIELLMDVDLPISIELGRTKMPISDILGLGPGSVVELNKLAGEPVDLLVNNKVVARGEVVVVDENFGLRITQLMTPEERLKALAQE